jgi:hypothetical protein
MLDFILQCVIYAKEEHDNYVLRKV